ncbi:uncharacterized protein LOC121383260 [Gigantopelta aegis]|uniref:uncharacterized protein LOC121383260 n=1 Tax=Gigantopelta aegis TaxID=1735272 RepID=UPI001B88756F|nr:uncharacterized protein LOC121383260 [Gigantopelta aegis]
MFPDYFDIRKIFCKVNEEQSLNLSTGAIASLSKEAFIDVGNILQKRRHEDFICTFKSKQTESFRIDKDPALHDKELKRKLEENRQKGKNKLAEVINKYADLQYNIPEKEESSDEDVSQESAIDVDDFDLDELSDEEVSIDKKGSTYSHSKPDKPERRRVVLTYLSISDDEVSTEKEGKQAAKCKETKQCLSLSHSDVSVENEKGPIASDNLPDEFKPREVTCPESERYLCLSDEDITAEKEDQVTCKKPKQYLTPSGEFKPREVTCPESEMYLCLSDEDITAEKEDQVTCKKPKQYQTPSGEIKPREVTCPESERYLCLSDEDSEKGDQVTCKKPKPYLTVSWEIKRREVVCVESKTYLSVSDEEDCADKSDLSSVTPAKVDSVETEVEEIQPRSTDRNIWPEPKRVTLVVKAFNERKDEPSVNSENVKKFNADSVSNKIKVVDINEESCTTGDNETSGSAIPSCNKVLVLDLTDDESYIYETSERKSRYENQVCKNKDTIEEIPGKDKDAGLQATLDSKISENHIGEMFEDELPDVEVIDDGSDINVKPSVSTETSNENSINNKDVDTGTADKEPIVEIDDEDEDDDDISEISKEKSVTDNKLDEEEESVVEITDDITDTQAIKILSDERPVDRICGRSNTKADIANTLKADSAACEKPVSPTTASSDSCKDTSPSSSSPSSISRIVTLMDKKIQLHIPKCLLKKTNNKGTAQVKSHFQVSTLKCEQRLNSGLVSMETSTDSTEVNIVSSSNIPADNDVILVSSGNFEAIDDDEIIILSD